MTSLEQKLFRKQRAEEKMKKRQAAALAATVYNESTEFQKAVENGVEPMLQLVPEEPVVELPRRAQSAFGIIGERYGNWEDLGDEVTVEEDVTSSYTCDSSDTGSIPATPPAVEETTQETVVVSETDVAVSNIVVRNLSSRSETPESDAPRMEWFELKPLMHSREINLEEDIRNPKAYGILRYIADRQYGISVPPPGGCLGVRVGCCDVEGMGKLAPLGHKIRHMMGPSVYHVRFHTTRGKKNPPPPTKEFRTVEVDNINDVDVSDRNPSGLSRFIREKAIEAGRVVAMRTENERLIRANAGLKEKVTKLEKTPKPKLSVMMQAMINSPALVYLTGADAWLKTAFSRVDLGMVNGMNVMGVGEVVLDYARDIARPLEGILGEHSATACLALTCGGVAYAITKAAKRYKIFRKTRKVATVAAGVKHDSDMSLLPADEASGKEEKQEEAKDIQMDNEYVKGYVFKPTNEEETPVYHIAKMRKHEPGFYSIYRKVLSSMIAERHAVRYDSRGHFTAPKHKTKKHPSGYTFIPWKVKKARTGKVQQWYNTDEVLFLTEIHELEQSGEYDPTYLRYFASRLQASIEALNGGHEDVQFPQASLYDQECFFGVATDMNDNNWFEHVDFFRADELMERERECDEVDIAAKEAYEEEQLYLEGLYGDAMAGGRGALAAAVEYEQRTGDNIEGLMRHDSQLPDTPAKQSQTQKGEVKFEIDPLFAAFVKLLREAVDVVFAEFVFNTLKCENPSLYATRKESSFTIKEKLAILCGNARTRKEDEPLIAARRVGIGNVEMELKTTLDVINMYHMYKHSHRFNNIASDVVDKVVQEAKEEMQKVLEAADELKVERGQQANFGVIGAMVNDVKLLFNFDDDEIMVGLFEKHMETGFMECANEATADYYKTCKLFLAATREFFACGRHRMGLPSSVLGALNREQYYRKCLHALSRLMECDDKVSFDKLIDQIFSSMAKQRTERHTPKTDYAEASHEAFKRVSACLSSVCADALAMVEQQGQMLPFALHHINNSILVKGYFGPAGEDRNILEALIDTLKPLYSQLGSLFCEVTDEVEMCDELFKNLLRHFCPMMHCKDAGCQCKLVFVQREQIRTLDSVLEAFSNMGNVLKEMKEAVENKDPYFTTEQVAKHMLEAVDGALEVFGKKRKALDKVKAETPEFLLKFYVSGEKSPVTSAFKSAPTLKTESATASVAPSVTLLPEVRSGENLRAAIERARVDIPAPGPVGIPKPPGEGTSKGAERKRRKNEALAETKKLEEAKTGEEGGALGQTVDIADEVVVKTEPDPSSSPVVAATDVVHDCLVSGSSKPMKCLVKRIDVVNEPGVKDRSCTAVLVGSSPGGTRKAASAIWVTVSHWNGGEQRMPLVSNVYIDGALYACTSKYSDCRNFVYFHITKPHASWAGGNLDSGRASGNLEGKRVSLVFHNGIQIDTGMVHFAENKKIENFSPTQYMYHSSSVVDPVSGVSNGTSGALVYVQDTLGRPVVFGLHDGSNAIADGPVKEVNRAIFLPNSTPNFHQPAHVTTPSVSASGSV